MLRDILPFVLALGLIPGDILQIFVLFTSLILMLLLYCIKIF